MVLESRIITTESLIYILSRESSHRTYVAIFSGLDNEGTGHTHTCCLLEISLWSRGSLEAWREIGVWSFEASLAARFWMRNFWFSNWVQSHLTTRLCSPLWQLPASWTRLNWVTIWATSTFFWVSKAAWCGLHIPWIGPCMLRNSLVNISGIWVH